ncbi:MAG TPA: hypothetical protein VGC16_11690 [Rhizomicrobium sp.]
MRAFAAPLVLAAAIAAGGAGDFGDETLTSPEAAIHEANARAPDAVPGRFALHIQSVGRQDENVYLNSEPDYRDQRNLSVEIRPAAIDALAQRYGQPPGQFFLGKNIVVDGAARREKIVFFSRGLPSDKYYYQTHVVVEREDQIRLMGF